MTGYDPPDPKERKKFMFYDTERRQVDLKIRLQYDGLNQSQFFRMIITGYLEQDEDIMDYVNRCKKQERIHNAPKRKISQNNITEGKETLKDFALNPEEIEDIFDLMEGDV